MGQPPETYTPADLHRPRSGSGLPATLGVFVLVSLSIVVLLASSAARGGQADPLFRDDGVLDATLSGPLRELALEREEDPKPRSGTLRYVGEDGRVVSLSVELTPRGKSRRDRSVCTMPPLWVRFDREAAEGTLFDHQRRLKLVTYCRTPKGFQDYVLLEYLAYRMLNLLSDASFRVRLMRLTYVDESRNGHELARYGFFIEHKRRLGKRLGMPVAELTERISPRQLVPRETAIAEVFQFMISNTDFSFIAPPENDECCHNAVLLSAAADRYIPVPYDFDRTGLVDPPRLLPAEELGQRSFRQRIFRGFCRDDDSLERALERTREARGAIEALIEAQEGLRPTARREALGFIADYYRIIDDARLRSRYLKCRKLD